MTTESMHKPIGISYEINCAAERIAPRSEYLLLDVQPASIIPTASKETIAIISNTPMSVALPCKSSPELSGITENAPKIETKIIQGANKNNCRCAALGTMSSF